MQKRLFFILLPLFLLGENTIFAQNSDLQPFLLRSDLTYYEELHGDLLSNADITMPVFAGCPVAVTVPKDAQCSQWESTKWILAHLSYPEDGYKAGWVGEFRIEYTIDEYGSVRDVELVNCESVSLAEQLRSTIAKMPVWTPAIYAEKKVAMRYYTQFGFFMGKNLPKGEPVNTPVLLTWGNAKAINNQLIITESELNTIKNEPITIYYDNEELTIKDGEMTFVLPHLKKNKLMKMDAGETLDDSRTAKLSAFIDAYMVKGSSISLQHLSAVNPNGGNPIQLPDFMIIIK
jgi:Gram-negative bacterial TonB protein C-terminal